MANYSYQQAGSGQDNASAWQEIINRHSGQNMANSDQTQSGIAMSQPLHAPVNPDEDAGLAPYFGGISAIIVIAFLLWRYFRKG